MNLQLEKCLNLGFAMLIGAGIGFSFSAPVHFAAHDPDRAVFDVIVPPTVGALIAAILWQSLIR